ncbi:MAG: hypothetical protein IT361_16085 [Gemmatimonadaceae bacterium]|nr:hypothetical protein [Gemmatimonadaceae bacterium]
MRRHIAAALIGTALLPRGNATAQGGTIDSQCRATTVAERTTQDACQKAIDLFLFMAPQLGGALTGGNAISGEHSVIGRGGHSSVGIRFNVVNARLPLVDDVSPAITGAVASDYAIKEQVIPVPTIDAAVGIFRGVPIGGSYAFGLDGLLNVAVVPSLSAGDFEVSLPDGPVRLGIGARVSLVSESVLTPGISFSFLRRDLPHLAVKGSPGADEIEIDDFQVRTSAWRGVIGKSLGVVVLTGGFGQDRYRTSTIAQVRVTRGGVTTSASRIVATQTMRRDNAFGSVALDLGAFALVAEGGRASGGRVATYNTFAGKRADDPLTYGSAGFRFRF